MTPAEHVALVGMMGVGKSTVGRLLAERWSCTFEDTDHAVEREAGRTVTDLFAERGESAFRSLEHEVLERLLGDDAVRVVSCGGGVVTQASNRELLAGRATVVWLTASLEVLSRRVGDGRTRPLLGDDPVTKLRELVDERTPVYGALADVVVDTTDRRPRDVADDVAELVR